MRFARRDAGAEEARGVVAHLLGGCPDCGTRLVRAALDASAREHREGKEPDLSYAQAIERATEVVSRRAAIFEREAALSHGAVPRLSGMPRSRQMLLVRNSRRFRTRSLCESLWAAGARCRDQDPGRAVELAELALAIAMGLDPEHYGHGMLVDVRARAAAELAEALRAAGRSEIAIQTMITALEALRHGTGDPLVRARVYDLAALVLAPGRRRGMAMRLLDRAFHLYRRFGDRHLAGCVLLRRAITTGLCGEPSGCLELLVQAAGLIDPQRDPRVAWISVHCMLKCLVEVGRHRAAAELLEESRHLYTDYGESTDLLRLARLEGRIAAGLGDAGRAEDALLLALGGALDGGESLIALLVTLDLGAVLLPQGRHLEARMLATELSRSVRWSEEVEAEARAALDFLFEAVEQAEVCLPLIHEVARLVERRDEGPEQLFAAG